MTLICGFLIKFANNLQFFNIKVDVLCESARLSGLYIAMLGI